MILKFKLFENWKDEVDENIIYTRITNEIEGGGKVIGKLIPEYFTPKSKRIRAYFMNGYVIGSFLYHPELKIGEPYYQNVVYFEWKSQMRKATQEEIEQYEYYNNINKYNL